MAEQMETEENEMSGLLYEALDELGFNYIKRELGDGDAAYFELEMNNGVLEVYPRVRLDRMQFILITRFADIEQVGMPTANALSLCSLMTDNFAIGAFNSDAHNGAIEYKTAFSLEHLDVETASLMIGEAFALAAGSSDIAYPAFSAMQNGYGPHACMERLDTGGEEE